MGCFEKVDVLNQHFGVPEMEGEYHKISVGKLDDYENFSGTYYYDVAAFEDSHIILAWSDRLIEAGFTIISLVSFRLKHMCLHLHRAIKVVLLNLLQELVPMFRLVLVPSSK